MADEAYAVLDALTTHYSPRESGTDQELMAAQHLRERLSDLGYETSIQKFGPYNFIWTDVHFESDEGEALLNTEKSHLHPFLVSSSEGSATGLLTFVGDTSQSDIPSGGLKGTIALMESGSITPDEQISRVAEAGAVGAIIVTSDPISVTVSDPSTIPVTSLDTVDGGLLLRLVEQEGEVTASIIVEMETLSSRNVVASKRGSADDGRSVILGAHYDTVESTQGASDNGSGLSALLTVSRHIADRNYPFDVLIVLFGAEEVGLLGSSHYAEIMSKDDIDSTIAMLNFDALGSGTTLHAIGDYDLTSEALKIGKEMGAPISRKGGGWAMSDHAPFEAIGISSLLLSSNDLSRINDPEDTTLHINPDLLGYAAEIGIAMLDSLAAK